MSRTAPRARRTWFQRFVIASNIAAAFVFVVTAAALAYGYTKYSRLPRIELSDSLGAVDDGSQASSGAQNFLLVGVDSAESLDPDDPARAGRAAGGLRSDTMMVLRVDPASSRAALLSLPRDLWVNLSTGGTGRINTAVEMGGPKALIETIREYFGIPIDHYLQVDFEGFGRIVDAIGGVPIDFPYPVRDNRSGLDVPEAGCVVLDARNALGFVRSRAYQEYFDGEWHVDGSGDLGRIRRQQVFMIAALERAFERGARNPVTLDALIDSTLDAVVVDDTLDGGDIVALAREFRSFSADSLDIYEIPVYDDVIGGAQVLHIDSRNAEPTLAVFRGTDPESVTERSVRVRVLNGTGTPGEAAEVGAELSDAGFTLAGTGDAARLGLQRTEIHYAPGQLARAELVDRWLTTPAELIEDDDAIDVEIVTGADYRGLRSEPRPAPETTTTLLPTTTTEPDDGSTTTILGTVPVGEGDATSCA